MIAMPAGVIKADQAVNGGNWNILGQTYTLKQVTPDSMAWHAVFPDGTFVPPHIHPDQGLDLALERMGENRFDILPVVNRANVHKLEGIVTLQDVLDAYGVHRA